jgi:DNA polymerase
VIQYKISATGKQVPAFAKSDEFMTELQEYNGSSDDNINFRVQVLAAARLQHRSTIEESRAERFLNIAKLRWSNGQPMMPIPLRYGGAHTHRLSGDWRMNPQNLPRDKTKSNLRRALLAPPGHKLITADLAQIEARIVARICEQQDLLAQFARGEDVYANFGSVLFNKPVDKRNTPNERWIGKTAVLGLGYGCGAQRFNTMVLTDSRKFDINLDGIYDGFETADTTVVTYRQAFSKISRSWRKLDHLLATILNNKKDTQRASFGPVWVLSGRILLPNKMYLRYDVPNQNLYGARLLENIVQALARIILMQAALRLADRGYRFVLQAHDELVFVVPDGEVDHAKEMIREEMLKEPEWLPVMPLEVELGVGRNYGEAK